MRLRIYKKNGNWIASILRGKGGFNSMVASRCSKNLFYCLRIISVSNILKALKK